MINFGIQFYKYKEEVVWAKVRILLLLLTVETNQQNFPHTFESQLILDFYYLFSHNNFFNFGDFLI